MELESEPGRGTVVRIQLPRAGLDACDSAEAVSGRPSFDPDAGLRVLLVEDQALVARSTARRLRSSGHHIAVAVDGIDALERFQAERPEVVVIDVDMPSMDGPTCYQHLRDLDPDVKVVFMSGNHRPTWRPTCSRAEPWTRAQAARLPSARSGPGPRSRPVDAALRRSADDLSPRARWPSWVGRAEPLQ